MDKELENALNLIKDLLNERELLEEENENLKNTIKTLTENKQCKKN